MSTVQLKRIGLQLEIKKNCDNDMSTYRKLSMAILVCDVCILLFVYETETENV